jgi:hypothetical protein
MSAKLLPVVLSTLVLFSILQAQTNSKLTASPTPAAPSNADDCGCDVPLPEVLATVNGVKITRQELTASQALIKALQEEVSSARKRELDLQINSQLLDEEAKKRGVSTGKILDEEVIAKVAVPSDAEALAFFEQNKDRIPADFATAKKEIIDYLRNQRQTEQAKLFADRMRAAAQIKLSGIAVSPPASEADLARVFATVNGKNITSADVEETLKSLVLSVQDQVYALRKSEMDMKINDILVVQEATKKATSTKALLEAEVIAKLPTISEAQAQKFYDENKEGLNGDFATLKAQLIEYLKEKAKTDQEQVFAQRLRSAATVRIFLTPLIPPRWSKPDPPKTTP